jgi:5-methylcytosine-specific restriction enzyme A
MTTRALPEWIGSTPDTKIPPRVKLRVFERNNGICQCGCGAKINAGRGDAWQTDHIIAIVNGGENRESNLRTLLEDCHKPKTAADVAVKSKTYRMRARHLGIRKPRTIRAWRKFDGTIVNAPRER